MTFSVRTPNKTEEKRKAICLEQLSLDRQNLLMRWPFTGGIMMRMELVPVRDDRLDTACTDGNSIFVDINFYATLDKHERIAVLAHEVWHSVLLHMTRKKNRDKDLFNQAADLEIHFSLAEEKIKEPWVLPHDPQWATLSAEEIYEKIFEREKKKKKESDKSSKGKGSFDRHIYEGDTLEEPPQSSREEGDPSEFVVDSDFFPCVRQDIAERVRGRIVAAAQQVEKIYGTLPGNAASLVEKLLNPQLPWREVLKQFVTTCYGGERRYLPPSRRHIWNNLYLPGMRSERLKAVVAVDTSGSTIPEMESFFTELNSLMQSFGQYEMTVIHCDAAVQKIENYSDARPFRGKALELKGGGGTDFRPVFEYVQKMPQKPDLLIYITDGYGPAPENPPSYPVLWVLSANGENHCPWGKVIQLKEK